ncbi:MAG: hydantoinase B/oxoprolinase family protein [Desulfitobacteriaceae bacterium]
MAGNVDQVTMQVIRYALEQIADEMGYTLVRTSRSTIIKEVMDITCAIFDAQGRTIAQAHHAPMLLTGFEITMAELIKHFPPGTLEDGDVVISNDPYLGGQHIMDIQTMAPVFFEGILVGYVGAIAHQADMGGSAPGGVAGGLTEIYQEGLRLPMVKLYKKFAENTEIFNILAANIRVPDKTLGDIRAQAACNFVGARKLQEVFAKFGREVVEEATNMLLDYSERRMRESIRSLPDGTYSGEDFLDDDGITDNPIPVRVTIDKHDDVIEVSFTGSSPQVTGNVNCPLATAMAAVYYTIIGVVDPHIPANAGCYRPVQISAAPGLIVNPVLPAAVAARTNTSQKILEAMLKAFAAALPERVMAGSHAQISTFAFSGYDPHHGGRRFVYTEVQGGGAGARPGKDAREAQDSHLARFMNTPIEAVELEYPVLIERYELIKDSGGAGTYRGSMGLRKDVQMLVDKVSFARYGDRQKFAPHGLFGGMPGSKGLLLLNPDTPVETRLKAKAFSTLSINDVVSVRLPGGGGYGNPRERDPELIKQDVRDGKVSVQAARQIYGWEG